jgi:hypothetical protein
MKIKYISNLVFIFILFTSASFAQGIKFGIGGGISAISNGNSGLTYNSGYHVAAKAKLDIPLFPLRPVVSIQYYILNGSYSFANFTGSTTQKILSAGLGVEYSLLPGPISPYLSFGFGFNNIYEVKYEPAILNQYSYPAISRTGLDIGGGVEISIPFLISFDINAKYNMLNLFGKQSGEGSISAFNLNLTVLF